MKKSLVLGAAAASLMAAPAFAQQSSSATMERILRELEALNQRVTRLENENRTLEQQNTELREKNDRLEATTEYLRANTAATRKELAEDAPKIDEADRIARAAEWASRITWKGDVRYRHENVDPEEATTDQDRERIRARFGLVGRINDKVSGTIQLATGGGNNDPRSTNQTLGSGWDRKQVAIDQAFVEWKPVGTMNVQLGKMPFQFTRTSSFFWDNDIMPEGGAVKYTGSTFFANAFGYWLSERSGGSDATLLGGQLGATATFGSVQLTGAAGYYDVGALQNKVTAQPNGCSTAFNTAFFGGSQGNTTVNVAGCPRLLNDFNMVHVIGQAAFVAGGRPLVLFADFMQNQEADDFDTGYAAGVTYGRASAAGTWEASYAYQVIEKDAQFGQFMDSDFGGGITDSEGSVFRLGYAPLTGWIVNGTYFLNKRFVDVGTERDYNRWQLDLNYRF